MALPPRAARAAAVAVALAIAVGSVATALALHRSLRGQIDDAARLGLPTPGLADDLRRAESPVRARLRLARALLTAAVEAEPSGGSLAGDVNGETRRRWLEEAERLGRSVLADHPASWEAAAVAGAALYLRWSEARDPRLLQEYRRWERPLLHALETAPDHRYPGRYLAAAYLELWPVLSEEKRALAEELVASSFTDRAAFARLLDPWFRVADGEAALAPVPDRSWAWATLRARAASQGDWVAYCESWRRERRSLLRELQARLIEAGRLADGGELARARRELLAVLAAAPADRDFAPIVERALRLLPHGPRRSGPSEPATRWLGWAIERDLVGDERPLSAESLVRLRALAFPDGSQEPVAGALSAWVELARGRPGRAEEIELRSGSPWQSEWAPYHLLAARRYLELGRTDLARRALEQVHPDSRRHPVFLALAERIDERTPAAGGLAGREVATPLDWSYAGATARLAFRARRAAAGVGVALAEVPAHGAVVAVRWDGAAIDCRPVGPAARRLELPLETAAGVHVLELEPLAGGRVYAGSVELLPPRRPGRPG